MQTLREYFKRPPIRYAIFFAALFPFLRGVNLFFLEHFGFRVFYPVVFGVLIGYYIGRQFEKTKELNAAREESQQEIISLMKKKSDLESENRARLAFIANSSHELRTPLNAVIGFSDLLIDDLNSDKEKYSRQINDLGRINKAGQYLLSLINDLLNLSKLNAGKMELLKENINIDLLLHDLVAISGPLVNKKNNKLVINNDVTEDVYADEMKLKQSMLNLISNAAKFTENGTITLSAKLLNEDIYFSVSDSGIGMTEEQMEVVFEEYQQAESSTARNYGGTGLGLPLTKQFIELMGGSVEVESEADKGSTFTLILPKSKPIN